MFVDRANCLCRFLRLNFTLDHFFVMLYGVSVSEEGNRRSDVQCVCDGGR